MTLGQNSQVRMATLQTNLEVPRVCTQLLKRGNSFSMALVPRVRTAMLSVTLRGSQGRGGVIASCVHCLSGFFTNQVTRSQHLAEPQAPPCNSNASTNWSS
jgi:hypothetical protein